MTLLETKMHIENNVTITLIATNNDHEPEDDVETTSGKNNEQKKQQKSTQNNKNQNDNDNKEKQEESSTAKHDTHDSYPDDKSLSSGSNGSSYQEKSFGDR